MGRSKPSTALAPELDDREQQLQADSSWARQDREVRRKFAGRVIAVSARKVIASAKTIADLKTVLEEGAYSLDKVVIVAIGV